MPVSYILLQDDSKEVHDKETTNSKADNFQGQNYKTILYSNKTLQKK